ncbi:MAG: glycoside hydrolase family 16 protein [Actinomycetota bacterium]|nr:glycoside hydrolase family 16 protein [Actinomycetota bacterium]
MAVVISPGGNSTRPVARLQRGEDPLQAASTTIGQHDATVVAEKFRTNFVRSQSPLRGARTPRIFEVGPKPPSGAALSSTPPDPLVSASPPPPASSSDPTAPAPVPPPRTAAQTPRPDSQPATPVGTSGTALTAGKSLAFASTFHGGSLAAGQWTTCYPWFSTQASGCTNFGNSQEEEWYLPSQDQVSTGILHLVATSSATQGSTRTDSPRTYPYRSGMVTTFASMDFTYGYVQVVAKLPGGTGTWPALWLLPTSEAWPPEIDIMENWGTAASFHATLHWSTGPSDEQVAKVVSTPANLSTTYHTYGLLWEPGSLTWYFDGAPVFAVTGNEVPSQPMYFLANLAIDGPAASGSSFDIQSVKIYTNNG